MNKTLFFTLILGAGVAFSSCKKDEGCIDPSADNYDEDADKDDGSCVYGQSYDIPTTYTFTDADGNNTVAYDGQTDRLNQLAEMTTYMKTGINSTVDAQALKDMFANTGDNGAGNFSFSSSKQLEDKCFPIDVPLFKSWMDSLAANSLDNGNTASAGQAGVISNGSKTYLVSSKGIEYVQLIEKGLMGAVFMHQAINVYFGAGKIDVDNSSPEDAANGKFYTEMEHHYDEAFGYFGVPTDFPTNLGQDRFWGKYCNSRDAVLGCNKIMMDNFIKGRAAISNNDMETRDNVIKVIRETWELISAAQAIYYYESARDNLGTDQAVFLHALSEGYAFTMNLKYTPTETRKMSNTEIDAILDDYDDLWNVTVADLNNAINSLKTKYDL